MRGLNRVKFQEWCFSLGDMRILSTLRFMSCLDGGMREALFVFFSSLTLLSFSRPIVVMLNSRCETFILLWACRERFQAQYLKDSRMVKSSG